MPRRLERRVRLMFEDGNGEEGNKAGEKEGRRGGRAVGV